MTDNRTNGPTDEQIEAKRDTRSEFNPYRHSVSISIGRARVHLTRSEAEKLAGELNSILPEPGTTPA